MVPQLCIEALAQFLPLTRTLSWLFAIHITKLLAERCQPSFKLDAPGVVEQLRVCKVLGGDTLSFCETVDAPK